MRTCVRSSGLHILGHTNDAHSDTHGWSILLFVAVAEVIIDMRHRYGCWLWIEGGDGQTGYRIERA